MFTEKPRPNYEQPGLLRAHREQLDQTNGIISN